VLTFRDPIHGLIRADRLESELIRSRPLQRLRSIRQLGFAYLIFPGAEHSRFSHVLGAMELAGRSYDALAEKSDGLLPVGERSRERRLVRAAALLHDIGHAPFSHSAEHLFEGGIDHEEMTRQFLETDELSGIFGEHGDGIDGADVAHILSGADTPVERLLTKIISGELDVDKMDYLLRDSLYCGVRYGSYDLDRLLDTVRPIEDPERGHWGIGVDEGGVHALEALVMARYYMFTQVYFNPIGKALELHFTEWLDGENLRWSTDPARFLDQDDISTMSAMRRSPDRHARAVVERRYFPLAYESGEHLSAADTRELQTVIDTVIERFPPRRILVSRAAKDPHRFEQDRVWVTSSRGDAQPIQEASHFIGHLERIDRFRVYAAEELVAEVGDAIRSSLD
jgi:HD superfamily phosphohydrolase